MHSMDGKHEASTVDMLLQFTNVSVENKHTLHYH